MIECNIRYRNHVTNASLDLAIQLLRQHDDVNYAKKAFHLWPTAEKLQVVWHALKVVFVQWRHKKDVEKDSKYLVRPIIKNYTTFFVNYINGM